MKINRKIICEKCHGSGSKKGDVDTKCKKCNASGREVKVVRQGNTIYQTQGLCSGCDGKKFVIPDAEKCEGCQGDKVVKDSKILNLEIEPGMQFGQQLSFYGESDQFPDTVTGDVISTLKPATEDSIFARNGNDLTCKREISLIEALSGAKILLKHLDDRDLVISTNDIIQPGERRIVSQQGMPVLNKPDKFGDLYIEFQVVLPSSLTPEQVTNIQKIIPRKPLDYNASTVVACTLDKISETDERRKQQKRQQEEEDDEGQRGHGGGVQCAQQ